MSSINCPSCNKKINNTEKICPNCGHIINKAVSSLFWISVSAICTGVVLLWLSFGDKTYITGYVDSPVHHGSMDVLEDKWCRNGWGSETICGIIHNNMGRTCSSASININLYDSAGIQIGTANDFISNLEAGVKWKFEANLYGRKAANYKIVEVYCSNW